MQHIRYELRRAVDRIVYRLVSDVLKAMKSHRAALDTIRAQLISIETGMAEWRPEVNLTDEQVAQIIARLSDPLAIPANVAEHVKDMCRYGNYTHYEQLGWGGAPLVADWTLRPNGEIALRLMDINQQPFWSGTFRGPA